MARQRVGDPASGIPARGTWEQYGPGNEAATRHGAGSERRVTPIAERLIQEALSSRPDLAEPRYAFSLRAWAVAEARCELFRIYNNEHADPDSAPSQPYDADWDKAQSRAQNLRSELGLSPMGEAKLTAMRAATLDTVDLDQFFQRGAQYVQRAKPEPLQLPEGEDTEDR